jgi:heme exporter protein C
MQGDAIVTGQEGISAATAGAPKSAAASRKRLDKISRILNWTAALLLLACLLMIFFYAPTERTMGNVQRILYFHVGAAWVSAIAFFVALLSGVMYLLRPAKKWDIISLASVEIGLAFTTMTIVAGSVWGRPAWNTWWIWSPRLTSITVMWLVYVAYFMLRGAIEDEDKRSRFAAVYVIVGFVTVIFTFLSIRILRDIHPVVIGTASEAAEGGSEFESGVESAKMGMTLLASTIVFSVLYAAWVVYRYRLQLTLDEVAALKARVVTRLQQR